MRITRLFALFVLTAAGLISLAARPPQDAPSAEDMAAMAEMMRLAQPGPEHAELAKYVGAWTGESSIFMAPGAPSMKQASSASCRLVLDGRFLQMESAGDFMGQPFGSMGMFGFDRRNEVWTTVGFDTLGTYWVSGSGPRDDEGVIRMHGRDDSPTGSQVYYFEIDFISDDEFTSSVFFTEQGPQTYDPPFKMVETRYTRK